MENFYFAQQISRLDEGAYHPMLLTLLTHLEMCMKL